MTNKSKLKDSISSPDFYDYWDDFDSNTKTVIVRDVFEYLCDNQKTSLKRAFNDYDIKEWTKFAIDRYWRLSYDERKHIDDCFKTENRLEWFKENMYPMLYEFKTIDIKS